MTVSTNGWRVLAIVTPVRPPRSVTVLSVKAKMTIDFEAGRWWRYAGAKETQIREHFGESATRYYARLNALLDEPAALAYDAQTIGRLRRLRDARRAARTSASLP